MYKVMLIDDEESLQRAMRVLLEAHGYAFCGATNGEEGMEMLSKEHPDLLLLDVMLPGINGFDLCQNIRAQGRRIPIIFMSAKSDIVDKTIGFRAGGDDYVTKPFDSAELLLRIEANIRRHKDDGLRARHQSRGRGEDWRAGGAFRRIQSARARQAGDAYHQGVRNCGIFGGAPGKAFTRSQIQEYIWGDADPKSNSITVFVRKIREKIEDNPSEPKYLLTVQRVGYKMTDEP